ncbi:MAG: hypothetical protein VB066_01775 [Paludibacter sp.]|nr:hypothetical protein [Paludibacter sp.]
MKKSVFLCVFSFLLCVGFACTAGKHIHSEPVLPDDQLQVLKDSVLSLNAKIDKLTFMVTTYENYLVAYENDRINNDDSIRLLIDSINELNSRPLMTKKQYIDLYKYERLLKYYNICKSRPVNWKYYKGWSIRVFEGD